MPPAALKEVFDRALALHQAGRLADAEALYRQVLRVDARHVDSLHLLGLAMVQSGRLEAGVGFIRQALSFRPAFAEAHYNLGNALLTLGRPAEALASFDAALALNPRDAQCQLEAGNALKDLGRLDEAIARFDVALRLDPHLAEAHNNRGIALKEAGRLDAALASYDSAIALRPRYAEAHSNRGNVLKDMGRFADALACHDMALDIRPDYAEGHYNRANALTDLKRKDEALAAYDRALALRPSYAEARHNKSLLLLGMGRYRDGFPLYVARWQSSGFASAPIRTTVPRWDGRPVAGDVLLWAEQGIGDEILHASMLSLVPEGQRVTVAADPRLHAIYRRSFPGIGLADSAMLTHEVQGGFAAQAPMGDLGHLLGVDAERQAQRRHPFLLADAARREAITMAPSFPRSGPVVGLAWKSANAKFGSEKSLGLAELAPLLQTPGLSFVNLQYGAVAADIAEVRASLGVTLHEVAGLDIYNDIDGLLALVDACDLVVTTSNITAHLAGAVGKRAAVLVPDGNGCLWYWQGGLNDLWYPSLTRLAQQRIGDWNSAIAAAAAWLEENT